MYDEKKLISYWKNRDKIHSEWRKNGWDGNKDNHGRDIKYDCGCEYWAGWGIEYKKGICVICKKSLLAADEYNPVSIVGYRE